MKSMRFALLLALSMLMSCSFEIEQPENAIESRYQVTSLADGHAILLDTATGEAWKMVGADSWRRLEGGPKD